jgi:aromatic-L-amino-acid/L-tryptophan decarboxylase
MSEHAPSSLDPQDWRELRELGHRMLDDMLGYLEHIRERPVWQPIPEEIRGQFREALPAAASPLADAYRSFRQHILPYAVGNAHPGFMGWVHGGGTPVGILAEMLAAGLNANVGGRDQIPLEVERQVLAWVRELFGFPEGASGLFVTGSSMANLISLLVARRAALGVEVRSAGVAASGKRLVAYTSSEAHHCIAQAMDIAGLGSAALRMLPVDAEFRMDLAALEQAIAADRASGLSPFLIAGTAGSVNTGAIDKLDALADIAARHQLWFHVDGAFGALAMLAPDLAPRLDGIARADSIAFDFHKWAQVPYDAGFVLVRDGALHQSTFASTAAYLGRDERGLAAGSPWPCDFGPDLSRGFRALKTWFTLKVYGSEQLGRMISNTCALARAMQARIEATRELELMAPVGLNIVCFRYCCEASDQVNRDIVVALQESGVAVPSTVRIGGRLAIRAALFNHRTTLAEVDTLLDAVLAHGRAFTGKRVAADASPPLMGLAVLMRMVFSGADVTPLSQELIARASADAGDANALMDLSTLLHLGFKPGVARAVQAQALAVRTLYTLPARAPAIRLLALMGPGDLMTNAPLEFLIENSDVTLHMQYLLPGRPLPADLPEHDLVFVAAGESERNRDLLQDLPAMLQTLSRPVLNRPQFVARTARDASSQLLQGAPGVAMPVSLRVSRAALEPVADGRQTPGALLPGGDFPIIVRPLDSHAGHGLAKIEAPAALAAYLAETQGAEFHIAPFIDYRSADGAFRKYRVALIDGVAYAVHMGVSQHWMIHYLNADMNGNAGNRAEEARFMREFDHGFGLRHKAALDAINRRIGLDYLLIDCAETPAGHLLVFEIDSGAVIHAMDPVELFPYKQPQMRKIFAAFRAMLANAIDNHRQRSLPLTRTGT